MARVRIVGSSQTNDEGYVIEFRVVDGERLYKLSMEDKDGSWENWYPENALERF